MSMIKVMYSIVQLHGKRMATPIITPSTQILLRFWWLCMSGR